MSNRPLRKFTKRLIGIEDVTPTDSRLKVIGVFNPGVERLNDRVMMLVRVAETLPAGEEGKFASPRVIPGTFPVQYAIDELTIAPEDDGDHRKPIVVGGHRRLAFVSHLELVILDRSGREVLEVRQLPDLFCANEYEIYGVEDPRITRIGDTFYITYVGVSEAMGVA
ncbi:MAG: hypothetical protein D6820_16580, partial [Lentisphaerae bacterium]